MHMAPRFGVSQRGPCCHTGIGGPFAIAYCRHEPASESSDHGGGEDWWRVQVSVLLPLSRDVLGGRPVTLLCTYRVEGNLGWSNGLPLGVVSPGYRSARPSISEQYDGFRFDGDPEPVERDRRIERLFGDCRLGPSRSGSNPQ